MVPLAMEFVTHDADRLHFLLGDRNALWVEVSIDLTTDLDAGLGRGGPDQSDDHLVANQRLATPVLGDEGEEAA